MNMKKIFSFLFACLSLLSGMAAGVTPDSEQNETELLVIMYHHVSERENLLNKYVITPEELESDMAYLQKNGYESVLPSQLRRGEIPEKPVMITFDDGFLSTYKYALPILQKYAMTGVCAVVGSLVQEYTDTPNTVSDCAYMNRDTVRKIRDSGVFEIACHTYDMHSLGSRKGCAKKSSESEKDYRTALTQDLTQFNTLYQEITGTGTDIIAFPYGEYSGSTISIAASCGYRVMLTCDEKINILPKEKESPLILGRFNRPHGISSQEFFEKITSR